MEPLKQTTTTSRIKRHAPDYGFDSDSDSGEHFPHFFVIQSNETHSLSKLSPFAVQKSLQCQVGTVKSIKKLQSGCLLVEVSTKTYADLLSKITELANIPVAVSAHRTLNSCRGIIRCRDIRDCDDAEILQELKSAGVTSVRRIFAFREGHKVSTNSFILDFSFSRLPTEIKIGYLHVPVEQYIPNPLRCFRCQRFGHGKNSCKNEIVCPRCSQKGHDQDTCSSPPHCANCGGDHSCSSRDCPEWVKQKNITKIKFTQSIPYPEAKKIYDLQSGISADPTKQKRLYSQTVSSVKTETISTQTELSWPLYSDQPIPTTQVSHPTSVISTQTESNSENLSNSSQQIPKPSASSVTRSNPSSKAQQVNMNGKPPRTDNSNRVNQLGRLTKGSVDVVKLHNKFGSLGDIGPMEVDHQSRPGSKITLK